MESDSFYTMNIKIIKVDYSSDKQKNELSLLLNSYAEDLMGGSKSLEEYVINNVANELAKRPHAFSVICYVDKKAAGLVNCFELFSTFNCKPLINIHDVIVLKEYRGKGLSHKMLKKVEEIAIEKRCCKLTLEVLSNNEIARSSYKKFGFSAYELDAEAGSALFWDKQL
jgi:ribosomal protein S18 acetylase RimI-like enzyme